MRKFCVKKNFGHFQQRWDVLAESKEDAWERAEKDGELIYQNMYRVETDSESKGFVVDLEDENDKKKPFVEDHISYLKDAIEKGMIVTPKEYELATGLPFTDV